MIINDIPRMKISLTRFPQLSQQDVRQYPRYEFHIRAEVRKKYEFDDSLYGITGNVIFPNFRAVRVFAQKMNARRDLRHHPEQTVKAGHLNAMGLIDEIFHHLLRVYEETVNPNVFARALKHLDGTVDHSSVLSTLKEFIDEFPPIDVHRNIIHRDKYLKAKTGNKPHPEITLEEIILLSLANFNPAFVPFKELFQDERLRNDTKYSVILQELEKFFRSEKPFGTQGITVLDLLRAPILACPDSLEGQLSYIKQHWGLLLGDRFLKKLLGAHDLIEEESKLIFSGGDVPTVVPTYTSADGFKAIDLERFTSDLEWMPKVVLITKNTYVWLDQLSKKYRRSITKLNEIPDEELDRLARWNFTSLWLIGIWERSSASQKIKQMTGNPEAVASAYSIYDYVIANDLGGEEAFQHLRHRAWARGIRLAGDMVPNHVGIYSKWVVEHPDYFIQSDYRPFPNYQFNGENLSEHADVDIRIEDGYWNRSDAAVAFQRVDKRTGNVRYLYHGNDGTNMPWNDTAQLNFLRAEVREAVIQMIFHVARKFSVIRFDAAMVLAKKHFQRLWFPPPGAGGAIPSRADYAIATEEFNRLFPNEFWREVVDRINSEMPNTLLLAEAFWLLEGYFVRTLGMHRVYNSAFMHMLMKEENAKYRELIRNTLHFNPEILKRYVNFMSNPDEQTAIAQFGKDDKYFGVAVLLVTLPGLPMFAHGQIDGFTEKYGMEYKRAYYKEESDEHLVRRHEAEIFPIMQKRHLFSQMTDFELYDFIDTNGNLNENVFAYSNMAGDERALICYHNKYEETAGWIMHSVGKTTSTTGDEEGKKVIRRTLGQALHIRREDAYFYIFKDHKTNLEFIRSGIELHDRGLFVELKAFHYHIFLDFREVHDTTGEYQSLAHHLNGNGVANINSALRNLKLAPLHHAFEQLFTDAAFDHLTTLCAEQSTSKQLEISRKALSSIYADFLDQLQQYEPKKFPKTAILKNFEDDVRTLHILNNRPFADIDASFDKKFQKSMMSIDKTAEQRFGSTVIEMGLIVLKQLEMVSVQPAERISSGNVFDRIGIADTLRSILDQRDFPEQDRNGIVHLIRVLLTQPNPMDGPAQMRETVHRILEQETVQQFLNVNRHENILYFNKERFELMLYWWFWSVSISVIRSCKIPEANKILAQTMKVAEKLHHSAEISGFKLDDFRNELVKLHVK